MPRLEGSTTFTVLSLGALVAGCQSAPVHYADAGAHATYQAAATGAGAVRYTGAELYQGAGRAIRAPLRDLNMMQDQIAPVLLRAETRPYDLAGVNSCADVLNRVSELDLSLGPDVDTPKQRKRTRVSRSADFATSTALDAAGSAAEHFIPMRSTLKQLSGASRYERHVQHAVLAGETRRSFLKAVGMAHNCSWPAAPLDFRPTQVADISAPWIAPPAPLAPQGATLLASTRTPGPASPGPAAPGSAASGSVAQPAVLTASSAPQANSPASQVAAASRATVVRPVVYVAVSQRLDIPAAVVPADPAQAWRPSPSRSVSARRAKVVEVSAPVSTDAGATVSGATMASTGSSSALAPWSSAFSSTSPARP